MLGDTVQSLAVRQYGNAFWRTDTPVLLDSHLLYTVSLPLLASLIDGQHGVLSGVGSQSGKRTEIQVRDGGLSTGDGSLGGEMTGEDIVVVSRILTDRLEEGLCVPERYPGTDRVSPGGQILTPHKKGTCKWSETSGNISEDWKFLGTGGI